MQIHASVLLLSAVAAALALPIPDDAAVAAAAAAAAGSKKNVYLSTCTYRGILPSDPTLAAIYYHQAASSTSSPADVDTISSRARTWEGATRRARLVAGRLESKIDSGAGDLDKSQIAGTAKLGEEDLVCFVVGATTFRLQGGLLGLASSTCTADYWCASIGSDSDE